jgi:hypothetical protein
MPHRRCAGGGGTAGHCPRRDPPFGTPHHKGEDFSVVVGTFADVSPLSRRRRGFVLFSYHRGRAAGPLEFRE